MTRPSGGYKNAAGKRVPGVTTILGNRKSGTEGLLSWANKKGLEGIDYRDARRAAANAGTLVHTMVRRFIDGKQCLTFKGALARNGTYTEEQYEQALVGFSAAQKWLASTKVRFIEQEEPLVSERHQYVGIPDAIGVLPGADEGEYEIYDWKSGKIYPDHVMQMSAYREVWEDTHLFCTITGANLIRFNTETGLPEHHRLSLDDLDLGWEGFKRLLEMYRIDQQVNKLLNKLKKAAE